MFMDERSEFCDAVALNTGAPATYLIGDQIDLGAEFRDIGNGETTYVVFVVSTTATSGGSATAEFQIASDDTAAISTSTATPHVTVGPFPVADMLAGTVLAVVALPSQSTYEQFLGVLQTTGTAAFTAGNVDVFLTLDGHNWRAYADNEK